MAGRATRKAAACNGAGESERTTRRGPEVHERERAVVLGRRGGCSEARAGDVRSGAAWRRVRRGRIEDGPRTDSEARAAGSAEVAGRRDALDVPCTAGCKFFFSDDRPSRLALFSINVRTDRSRVRLCTVQSARGLQSHTTQHEWQRSAGYCQCQLSREAG